MSAAPPVPSLPIDAVLPELLAALAGHPRCLLVAQPGAGKTTRVPLALLDDPRLGGGRWLLLEPRRAAARLAAGFMAASLGEAPGGRIGYRVRGDSRVGPRTRLEVVTQGILTRLLQDDPSLDGVAGILFDEFHERSLEADLGLALALDVQGALRPDLKLLVMSATLDVEALLGLLGSDTPLIASEGRAWPVTTLHRAAGPQEEPERLQARVVREALAQPATEDLLVFLPGQREIRRLENLLLDSLPAGVDLQVLHGQLPLDRQQAVLQPAATGRRRIILATAIAESSLTVPGVNVVIDAGRERVPVYQPRSGLTRLETRQVNRASADQRRGRAGRLGPGTCYRLWPQDSLLPPQREPEIQQAELSGLVFELARWGLREPGALPWITPPPAAAWNSGVELLRRLGLLDASGALSAFGRACARWPAHPRLAVLLENAAKRGLLALACWLAAWLEESFSAEDSDLERLLERRHQQDAQGRNARWRRAASLWAKRARSALDFGDSGPAAALLARAFPDRIAQRQSDGRFKLVSGGLALLPASAPLARADWLIALELDGDPSGARVFLALDLPLAVLEEEFPETREWREKVFWDAAAGRLRGEAQRRYGPLVLEGRRLDRLPAAAVQAALLQGLRERGLLPWREADRQLLGRLRLLRRELGEPWPDCSDAALLDRLEDWLAPQLQGLDRLEQIEGLPLGQYLLDSLDWRLRQDLDRLAPSHLPVPSGSRIALDYSGEEPVLAVKLQELFGQTQTPRILDGRLPVLIHLLSPARRPVQMTRDLASFWAKGYFEVRKDLKGRYPKHPWPDDPLSAEPTRRAKPRPD